MLSFILAYYVYYVVGCRSLVKSPCMGSAVTEWLVSQSVGFVMFTLEREDQRPERRNCKVGLQSQSLCFG